MLLTNWSFENAVPEAVSFGGRGLVELVDVGVDVADVAGAVVGGLQNCKTTTIHIVKCRSKLYW